MNILIIGSAAREHAIARTLSRSPQKPTLFCYASSNNPGIRKLTSDYYVGDICHRAHVMAKAVEWNIHFAIIGPEAPLEVGMADALWSNDIPVIGPKKMLAKIETSKSFARHLLQKYDISGQPVFKVFADMQGVNEFLQELGEENYVIKANGLMGGKGVKVAGDHLHSIAEALQFCEELVAKKTSFVIEEKFIGPEFSLLCFSDGHTLIPMPLVQDHKRAWIHDRGPNTGGMGSYSDANHLLPFVTKENFEEAFEINKSVIAALTKEYSEPYIGILYGSFMLTSMGVKVIEFNARFGDPEVMNVLPLLETDFVTVCQSMISGELNKLDVKFSKQATVCKYTVPEGYPDDPVKNVEIDISQVQDQEQLYLSSIDERTGKLIATGSRAVAFVGISDTLTKAEQIAECEIQRIKGPLFHREDIGTHELILRKSRGKEGIQSVSASVLRSPMRLAIVGSTNGTDMLAIIDAIHQQKLDAFIEVVISDKPNAMILRRARAHGLKSKFLDPSNYSKSDYDQTISEYLQQHQVDLVVLIGYMRILSNQFVIQWKNKIINVHPSLLPDFAGGMDLNVHQAVLDAEKKETGCTVHHVTEAVDAGPILIQKKCEVLSTDTAETLKKRVQGLEGQALIEAIKLCSPLNAL